MSEELIKVDSVGVEIANYRIRKGVVNGVNTVNVVGKANELLPFVTVVKGEISEKVDVLIKKHIDKKNDGKEAIARIILPEAIDRVILPTEFYELRNANNEIVFITDLSGFQSLYMNDLLLEEEADAP
jgi:hypothetical protein